MGKKKARVHLEAYVSYDEYRPYYSILVRKTKCGHSLLERYEYRNEEEFTLAYRNFRALLFGDADFLGRHYKNRSNEQTRQYQVRRLRKL